VAAGSPLPEASPHLRLADGPAVAAAASAHGGLAVIGLLASAPGALLVLLAALAPAIARRRWIPYYRLAELRFAVATVGVAWLLASIVIVIAL
jgi:hypothetical protein